MAYRPVQSFRRPRDMWRAKYQARRRRIIMLRQMVDLCGRQWLAVNLRPKEIAKFEARA